MAVPIVIVLALSQFPGYDARSEFFAGTYRNIVEAGDEYLVSLLLFLVVAAILTALAVGLWRSELRQASPYLWVVVGGLALSAVGFAVTALSGLPVWWWARQVNDGSLSVLEAADRSGGLASFSQTMLLTISFGGMLVGLSALGVIAVVQRWIPLLVFWGTVGLAVALVALAVVVDGPALWVGFGLLPMLWSFVFGLVLLIRGEFVREADLAAG